MLLVHCLVIVTVLNKASSVNQQDFTSDKSINPGVRPVLKSESYGGSGGDPFDDFTSVSLGDAEILGVRNITITYAGQMESIQVTYLLSNGSFYHAPKHGGYYSTNKPFTIKLATVEYGAGLEGKTNNVLVDQLSIITVMPRDHLTKIYGPFGVTGKQEFSSKGYIVGFYGRAGNSLNSVGVYQLAAVNKSSLIGGGGDLPTFDENPDTLFPPVVKINKLYVNHGQYVYSIRAQYLLLGGTTRLGKNYGTSFGNVTVIRFDSDEELIGIEGTKMGNNGTYVDDSVCQLTFISKKGYTLNYNGPFGWPCPIKFSLQGNIMGIFGVTGNLLTGIGIYYV